MARTVNAKGLLGDYLLFILNALKATINSHLLSSIDIARAALFVYLAEPLSQEMLLWSCSKTITYFVEEIADDQDIWCYIRPGSTTPMHKGDDLYHKSCNHIDVYDESTLKSIIIYTVKSSICHSFREGCTSDT